MFTGGVPSFMCRSSNVAPSLESQSPFGMLNGHFYFYFMASFTSIESY
jgi:hypothetical protein